MTLERLAHRNALAVRFRDVHTGAGVVSGLSVRVLVQGSGRVFVPIVTPSGVFTLRALPGLGPWQTRAVDAAGAEEPVPVRAVVVTVEVRDTLGRFLPGRFTAVLPIDGLIDVDAGSPPSSPPGGGDGIPLYSAPGRGVPAELAVVRASLVHAIDGRPAAYAALEVIPAPGAEPVRGVADERGEVLVLFPYPAPPRPLGSPPTGAKVALSATRWPVELRGYLPRQPPGPLPEIDRLLDQRPAALATTTPPAQPVTQAEIQYGRECVLWSTACTSLAVGP